MSKRLIFIGLIVFVAVFSVFPGSSNSDRVAILYHGVSSVNRHALQFIRAESRRFGGHYTYIPVSSNDTIRQGEYKAILILNTGVRSGIDPVLSDFIKGWDNKSNLILISLKRGSSDIQVESIAPSKDTLGVDAVSAASRWRQSGFASLLGGGGASIRRMHAEWLSRVMQLLNQMR